MKKMKFFCFICLTILFFNCENKAKKNDLKELVQVKEVNKIEVKSNSQTIKLQTSKIKITNVEVHSSPKCTDWLKRLELCGYQRFIGLTEIVTKAQVDQLEQSECKVIGTCSIDSVAFTFEINQANCVIIKNEDTTFYLMMEYEDLSADKWAPQPNYDSDLIEVEEISETEYRALAKENARKYVSKSNSYFYDDNDGNPINYNKKAPILKLFCDNDTLVIKDRIRDNEDANRNFDFYGKVDSLNLYIVKENYWEGHSYLFYDCETCLPLNSIASPFHEEKDWKNRFPVEPIFSDDYTKAIGFYSSPYSDEYKIETSISFFNVLPDRKFEYIDQVNIYGNYFNGIDRATWLPNNRLLIYSRSGFINDDEIGAYGKFYIIQLKGIYE